MQGANLWRLLVSDWGATGREDTETPVYYTKLIGLKVQKAAEKALALLKGNLELPLRPIQATQMTTGPFWTRQKRLEAFWTSNRNLVTWNPFSIEGAQKFTEPLKHLCTMFLKAKSAKKTDNFFWPILDHFQTQNVQIWDQFFPLLFLLNYQGNAIIK